MWECWSKIKIKTIKSDDKPNNRHVRRRRRRKQQLRQWWESVFVHELLFYFHIGTSTFYKNANSQCANVEAKQRWKRQTQTTNNKNVMQDDDGDEQLSLQTMPISICTRRTLMVVPHWHIDFLQKMQKSMCECGAKENGNDRIKRQNQTTNRARAEAKRENTKKARNEQKTTNDDRNANEKKAEKRKPKNKSMIWY